MLITVPVLRPGLATAVRAAWKCPDRVLPESLVVHSSTGKLFQIDPGPNVVVKEVSFGSVCRIASEPWVIVWVTVEVPDGTDYPVEFKDHNPKEFVVSKDSKDHAMRRFLSRFKDQKTADELLKHHAAIMADSEPDEVKP